jgi:hypothetical protein
LLEPGLAQKKRRSARPENPPSGLSIKLEKPEIPK